LFTFCIPGVQKCARIVFEVVIVQRVSAAAANVHALLLTGSVIPMFAETAGLGMTLKVLKTRILFVTLLVSI
jgi:hypothetical protein